MRTAICDLFDIQYPILQGGMAWLGTAELVAEPRNLPSHVLRIMRKIYVFLR